MAFLILAFAYQYLVSEYGYEMSKGDANLFISLAAMHDVIWFTEKLVSIFTAR